MRFLLSVSVLVSLAACGTKWDASDLDGDGVTVMDGDCNDNPDGGGAGIFPGATETWYDGVDQDCGNDSDFDKDKDGVDALGSEGGTDCWDDPDVTPPEYTPLNGFAALDAAEVFPGAGDTWYDGIDQDCDGASDFDQDQDGYDTSNAAYTQRDGSVGDDCFDTTGDDYPTDPACTVEGDALSPGEVYPGATDEWYDGTDANCDGNDFDADGDAYPACEECDDTNASIYPNDAQETWYNGIDENCDSNDGDQDGDGYYAADYPYEVPEFYHPGDPDCWDDPTSIPADFEVIRGDQPEAGEVSPEATETWYDGIDQDCAEDDDFDQDGDSQTTDAYTNRSGVAGDDCDDVDPNIYLGAGETWYNGVDDNCDGGSDFDQDADGFDNDDYGGGTDCDDLADSINPGMNEDCSTTWDDNCDTDTDLEDAEGCSIWFYDGDSDNYGDPGTASQCWCLAQTATGWDQADDDDCDDDDADTYPGAASLNSATACMNDDDNDNYGDESPPTGVTAGTDCNDGDSAIKPGATESAGDEVDQNCDDVETCYKDTDNDGYVTTSSSNTVSSTDVDCDDSGEAMSTEARTDCDDADADTYVGAASSDSTTSCMNDDDGDNYGDETVSGSVVAGTDCNDASSSISPAASETTGDSVDYDCNDQEVCYKDTDNDNYITTSASNTVVSTDTDCGDSGEGTSSQPLTDCDDADAQTFPGVAQNETSASSCMNDDDDDGYGDESVSGTVVAGSDCDDGDSAVKPGVAEVTGDEIDQNCDDAETCYLDNDNDGYVTTATSNTVSSTDLDCDDTREAMSTEPRTDCVDSDDDTFPGAAPSNSTTACMTDADGDDYGSETAPSGGTAGTDCNDGDSAIKPSASEVAGDEVDQNCDDAETCYKDTDNDGYVTTSASNTTSSSDTDCDDSGEAMSTEPRTDCDDSDDDTFPGVAQLDSTTSCMNDDDNDGYGDTTAPSGGTAGTDCDDASNADYPGATETVNNGNDEDCDGVDSCYTDADNDDYGTTTPKDSLDLDCTDANEATVSTDCDDASATTYPGAAENESSSSCRSDADLDGYGDDSVSTGVTAGDDCDDADGDTFPGAAENESASSCRNDDDGDGYGDDTVSTGVTAGGDCDDTDSAISPAASEVAGDEIDQNCDTDETCYKDADNDGYVVSTGTQTVASTDTDCDDSGEAMSTEARTDCDDGDVDINPGEAEITADEVDQNCDNAETCYTDSDGDTYGSTTPKASADTDCSDATEANDANDCDDGDAQTFPGVAQNESSPSLCRNDDDNDGYGDTSVSGTVVAGTDCDDGDAQTFPGVAQNESTPSLCYNDDDNDGYGDDTVAGSVVAGTDCDDTTSTFSPGVASDVWTTVALAEENEDCDNFTDEDSITAGSLVITEYFTDGDANHEWIEVYNTELYDIELGGWKLYACSRTGGGAAFTWADCVTGGGNYSLDEFTIVGPLPIVSGTYTVLCYDSTTMTQCDAEFGASYTNVDATSGVTTDGGFRIAQDGEAIDTVLFLEADWPEDVAASTELCDTTPTSVSETDNDSAAAWAVSAGTTEWATGYFGTPGALAVCL